MVINGRKYVANRAWMSMILQLEFSVVVSLDHAFSLLA